MNSSSANQMLAEVLREKSGFELAELDPQATFLELGFDSLFLIQLSQTLRQRLGVKVTFRQLMEELVTVEALQSYLAAHVSDAPTEPASASIATPEPPATEITPAPVAAATATSPEPTNHSEPAATNRQPTPPISNLPSPQPSVSVEQPIAQASAPAMPTPLPVVPSAPTPPPTAPLVSQSAMNLGNAPMESLPTDSSPLQQIVHQQTQLMAQHLQILSGINPSPLPAPTAQPTQVETAAVEPQTAAPVATVANQNVAAAHTTPVPLQTATPEPACSTPCVSAQPTAKNRTRERFGPYKPLRAEPGQGLSEQQRNHLDSFVKRFIERTPKSRRHAEEHRDRFADPRGVAGYRRIWKSMVYQIVVEKSKGSKLWDIDGNEYVDIAMGFGLNLFGQSPDFVTRAVQRQLERGVEVGPQTPLAGEVAQLLCEFSRQDRVTFCNTGSEAVMAALRLARTVTGKTKCVFFNKDYHGNFDEVLLRSNKVGNKRRTSPAAPGVPQQFADNAIVLDYGTEEALQVLRERAGEIASVLIEPVQSADPFLQPGDFLKEVRQITRDNDIAMIMDEVISGFRAAPGGAQEWFGVWGDMATYGKVLGGGLPIGALAGSKRYMDALDGGTWRFDDSSEPEADMTFFAGTFVRHPLAITAAHQILMKVKEEGPQLQLDLTARTTRMVERLNQFFEEQQFPIRVAQFTSLFRFMFPPDLEYADMLYFHLLERGIFTRGWGDNCFLSTTHTDQDVERIIAAVQESCLEIRAGGFFPDRDDAGDASTSSTQSQHAIAAAAPQATTETPIPKPNGLVQTVTAAQFAADPPLRLDTGSLLSEIQPEGSRPPLFCAPAADGLTLVYHDLADALGPDQPVYGLTSPGVFGEELPTNLEDFCARFVQEIKSIQPTGPYNILGYCSGGTVAFEIAQQLKAAGDEVATLACVETYHWQHAASTNPTLGVRSVYQAQRLWFVLRNFLLLNNSQKLGFFRSKWDRMASQFEGFKTHLRAKLSSRRGSQKRMAQQSKAVDMQELWRIHDELCEEYRPVNYPGRLLHFRPARDYRAHVTDIELEADNIEYHRLRAYPAGTMTNPFVEELAEHLAHAMQYSLPRRQSKLNRAHEATPAQLRIPALHSQQH